MIASGRGSPSHHYFFATAALVAAPKAGKSTPATCSMISIDGGSDCVRLRMKLDVEL
eukprot:COSAG01_NODE_44774_length_415_cov_5.712025_1_plen_56_part_01